MTSPSKLVCSHVSWSQTEIYFKTNEKQKREKLLIGHRVREVGEKKT